MTNITQQTLASIVINDHRAAVVLEKYHLDFCCKGKRTLADACAEKGFLAEDVGAEIASIPGQSPMKQMPFAEMTAEQLISYVVIHHHFYVKQIMPQLHMHLEKVAAKHGDRFPEMAEVFRLFGEIRDEMTMHMQKEELVLFPAIKKVEKAYMHKNTPGPEAGIIKGAVSVMEMEHDNAGCIVQKMRELTGNYHEPAGACTTFRLCLAELKAFEEDLHQHVHIENNILFPMALGFVS